MREIMKYFNESSISIGLIGGGVASFLGGWDKLLYTLIVFICIDYVTGLIKGCISKNITSQIGFKGIAKKVMMLLLVAVAYNLQDGLNIDIALREIVITFFVCNEGISILENAAQLGLPIPQKLKDILLQLRGGEDENRTETTND